MIQGTMSNSGKSFIAAALCRIFRQDGYSAAPFKSQNMALNSYITSDGLEMGRAQAMQAEAAGIEPSVLMNPILLKPTTDVGSQVIVNGEVRGNMKAVDYFRHKKDLIPDIMKAYNELAAQHDIIVIEGAGSPAEINLKRDDIVNMGMAKLANAPVLLTGDIDRGGVFAQLLGTLMLLENDERNIVKGLIVNKFRGDKSIFSDGVKMLEERGNKPVVGVVPYINCDIEDEDSLSEKLRNGEKGLVNIAVIRLPRISNFTDFDVFSSLCHKAAGAFRCGYDNRSRNEKHYLRYEMAARERYRSRREKVCFKRSSRVRNMRRLSDARRNCHRFRRRRGRRFDKRNGIFEAQNRFFKRENSQPNRGQIRRCQRSFLRPIGCGILRLRNSQRQNRFRGNTAFILRKCRPRRTKRQRLRLLYPRRFRQRRGFRMHRENSI